MRFKHKTFPSLNKQNGRMNYLKSTSLNYRKSVVLNVFALWCHRAFCWTQTQKNI